MSQYQSRWASCQHGKRNSRVCVKCWTMYTNGSGLRPFDISEDIMRYQPTAEFATAVLRLGLEHPPATDRRDHEWVGSPKARVPDDHMTARQYGERYGWRR